MKELTKNEKEILLVLNYMGKMLPEKIPGRYKYDWNRIVPVVKKLKRELNGSSHTRQMIPHIDRALNELSVSVLWNEIVESIELLNKLNNERQGENTDIRSDNGVTEK